MPRDEKPVAGSHRTPYRNAKVVGKVAADQRIEVTVRVRPRQADTDVRASILAMSAKRPSERTYLSREDLEASRGADPADLAKIDAFAHAYNLTVVETSVPKRTVRLSGTVADISRAFGVQLQKYKSKEVTYRGRTGQVYVPSELADIVEGVFGLDNRPAAKPHFRRLPSPARKGTKGGARPKPVKGKGGKAPSPAPAPAAAPRNAADGSFAVPEVAQLYNFPTGLDGTGQTIALIELNDVDQNGKITGAGYALSDLQTFFGNLNLPTPDLSAIGVDGGANMPGQDANADGEVTLDVEVAGAVAPAAKIAVYFTPNTDAGFIDAVNAAIHDTVRRPAVISISWGGPEDSSTDQFLNGLNQALQDAAAIGVTVCVAAGDDGSSDESADTRDGQPHADFPASSPFALACGGTKLIGSGATISSEVVWNEGDKNGAGGGGVSNKFPLPDYQSKANVPASPLGNPGRGVPDVAGNADPQTGYRVVVGGKESPIGGTSAVAPLWAGLIALLNQSLAGKGGNTVGFWNGLIYGTLGGTAAFHDITQGNNDIDGTLKKYSAGPGWDACTGMGSPNGAQILQAL